MSSIVLVQSTLFLLYPDMLKMLVKCYCHLCVHGWAMYLEVVSFKRTGMSTSDRLIHWARWCWDGRFVNVHYFVCSAYCLNSLLFGMFVERLVTGIETSISIASAGTIAAVFMKLMASVDITKLILSWLGWPSTLYYNLPYGNKNWGLEI